MIDEYQDTNRLQESILMKLTSLNAKNLIYVGDVKQSIYRFREADHIISWEISKLSSR